MKTWWLIFGCLQYVRVRDQLGYTLKEDIQPGEFDIGLTGTQLRSFSATLDTRERQ